MRSKFLALFVLITLVFFYACAPNPGSSVAPPSSGASSSAPSPLPSEAPKPAVRDIILSTTTSTRDSGLLDELVPVFEKQSGYRVKTIAVGSGQALALGERGEADVLLVHAPEAELKFMTTGAGINRRLVMHNDFVIIGPASDPVAIRGENNALKAIEKIYQARALFMSRGDESGTHQLEKSLWKKAELNPDNQGWYQQSGQGMGATLSIANEKNAYTISDRATFLAFLKSINLQILSEGDSTLLNVYHVIQINSGKFNRVNAEGGKAFADFMVSAGTQDLIGKFGVEKYGQPLFFPDAGKPEYK